MAAAFLFASSNKLPFLLVACMLKELSTKMLIKLLAAEEVLLEVERKGCANASTKNIMVSIRANKISRFFSFSLEECCSSTSFKNFTLEKYIFLNRLKLNRCITTGMAIANNAKRKPGYRKLIKNQRYKNLGKMKG